MARPKRQSRAMRWGGACSEAREALEKAVEARDSVNEKIVELIESELAEPLAELFTAMEALDEVKQEFQEWRDNLPENLSGSALGEKLDTVVDLETDPSNLGIDVGNIEAPEIELDLDEVSTAIDEAEGAELPLGFGRD
jgi:translation elongation factor EF-G